MEDFKQGLGVVVVVLGGVFEEAINRLHNIVEGIESHFSAIWIFSLFGASNVLPHK
jgi:hypothetical protein